MQRKHKKRVKEEPKQKDIPPPIDCYGVNPFGVGKITFQLGVRKPCPLGKL